MSKTIHSQISDILIKIGAKASIISIDNSENINRIFTDITSKTPYSDEFFEIYLKRFKADYRDTFPGAKSIIIVAYPQVITEVKFIYRGRDFKTIIPPTYIYREQEKNIKSLLQKILSEYGYLLTHSILPEKLSTVISGLGKYGKNNLCYVKGMGSFNTPIIYLSDLPVEKTLLSEMSLASPCKNCTRCVDSCPTGAINKESFVINPEICITYFNENEFELPDWILEKWQNTLVGCMICQRVCPMNNKLLNNVNSDTNFSETETELLLQNTEFKALPPSTKEKLTVLCMDNYYEIIPRNLKLLLSKTIK